MTSNRRPGQTPPPLDPYPSFEQRAYGAGQRPPSQPQPSLQPPPRRRHPPRPHRRRSWLSSVFVVLLLGVAAVVSGAAVFLLMTPPTSFLQAQIIDQVKSRTGRDLTIAGPTSFTFFPRLGLSMSDVTLSQPPGLAGPPFAKMKQLDVAVRVLPLLKRQVAIDRLVLQKPVIHLLVDARGAASWDFATADANASAPPVRLAQAGGTVSDAPGGLPDDARAFLKGARDISKKPSQKQMAALRELQLGDVRIVDGTLHYADAKAGTKQRVDAVNVQLGLDRIDEPLTATGDLKWQNQTVEFQSKLTSVANILQQQDAKLGFNMKSAPVTAAYQGTVTPGDTLKARGSVQVQSGSVRTLAAWLGSELPPALGFGALNAKGQLSIAGPAIDLRGATLTLDDQTATGDIAVRTGGIRPSVRANLKLDQLNLNNYMGDGSAKPRKKARAKTPENTEQQARGRSSKPSSIEDLLGGGSPTRVRGYSARSGWSTETIENAMLGLVDANADLNIGKLFLNNLKIGQTKLGVALQNKVLKANLNQSALYQGQGKGFVTVDGTVPGSTAVGVNLTLSAIDALPLLKDLADQDWLTGKGTVTIAAAGQGKSQKAIISTLNGKAGLRFNDGAIVGINVPGIVRGISQGQFTKIDQAPTEKTDFSEMSANWDIKSGVATNSDLSLVSPLLRVGGNGKVMLPQQTVDYTIRPKLVAKLEGQGGKRDASGLVIPVRVHGAWADPKFTPDLGDILKDPSKALDAVQNIGKQFKGKNANEVLDGLLGGGGKSGGDSKTKAKDLLDQFLR
jgi:AsmA protein